MTTIWKATGGYPSFGKERGKSLWYIENSKEKRQQLTGTIHTEVAMVLKDKICYGKSEYQKVYYPRRMMFSGSKNLLKDTGIITKSLLREHLKIPRDKLDRIEQNQSGIVIHKGQKVGVYRDMNDDYHMVSTKCPHLGCSLEWNQNELTWDCPCHGSRFDYRGNIITNPATRGVFDACKLKKTD